MEQYLQNILAESRSYIKDGHVATYIPELAKQDPYSLGMYILCADGSHYSAGQYLMPFTIQSVMKPVLLLLALMDNGIDYIREHVGVEATGKPFDAINVSGTSLLSTNLNPMVNAGAILMCQLLKGSSYDHRFQRLLDLIRVLAENPSIDIDEEVYRSESATGAKNRALAYLLKSHGMIWDNVEDVLACYFKACSIRVCSKDLAHIGFVLANHGRSIDGRVQLCSPEYARFVNAILATSGMYDGSGDFAIRVGFPAKSGVAGGIMGVVPTASHRMGIGIFGPALDDKGNSIAGIHALEQLSKELDLSIL